MYVSLTGLPTKDKTVKTTLNLYYITIHKLKLSLYFEFSLPFAYLRNKYFSRRDFKLKLNEQYKSCSVVFKVSSLVGNPV